MKRTESQFIKDIRMGMKNLNVTFIVLEVGAPVTMKDNREVRTAKVADVTACINWSVWGDTGYIITPGDIIKLTKAYTQLYRNSLTLCSSKVGTVEKVGNFCMVFNEQLNMSEPTHPTPESTNDSGQMNNGNNGDKGRQGKNSTPTTSTSQQRFNNVSEQPNSGSKTNSGGNGNNSNNTSSNSNTTASKLNPRTGRTNFKSGMSTRR